MRLTHLKKLPRRNSLPARQNWSRWKSGGRMRRVLARRTAWWAKQGTRPVAAKDQRTKSAWIFGAICPARGGRACPAAVQYLRDARAPGRDIVTGRTRLLSSSLTRRAGTPPANWISRTISPCCRHAARPRSKMSGNICDKTGCQTASFRTRSFPSVVTHGIISPTGHGKSGPLGTENGPMGSNFQELVSQSVKARTKKRGPAKK